MNDYFEDIKKLIVNQFGLKEEMVEEESFLEADLNITDLDMEDLAAKIEDRYAIEIPQEDYSKFKQVSDIAAYIYEHVDQI